MDRPLKQSSKSAATIMTSSEEGTSSSASLDCSVCGKRLETNLKLKAHEKYHSLPTKKCPYCDKILKRAYLKAHLRAHTGEQPSNKLFCIFCDKMFFGKEKYTQEFILERDHTHVAHVLGHLQHPPR